MDVVLQGRLRETVALREAIGRYREVTSSVIRNCDRSEGSFRCRGIGRKHKRLTGTDLKMKGG
jgi:hypothetical protein